VRPARGQSEWRGNELYPAHFALTDEAGKTFVHYERFAREALGAGFASTRVLDVRDEGWTLTGPSPFRLHASVDGKAIDFHLRRKSRRRFMGMTDLEEGVLCYVRFALLFDDAAADAWGAHVWRRASFR